VAYFRQALRQSIVRTFFLVLRQRARQSLSALSLERLGARFESGSSLGHVVAPAQERS